MKLTLDDKEVELLRRVLEGRMDELLKQLSASDTHSFKEALREEEAALDGLFRKLGCYRPERSLARTCAIEGADELAQLTAEEVG